MSEEQRSNLATMTAEIVASYVANNGIGTAEVASLIGSVYDSLKALGQQPEPEAAPEKPKGAVGIRKSLASSGKIISMIDGKPYAMLMRHINGTATHRRATVRRSGCRPITRSSRPPIPSAAARSRLRSAWVARRRRRRPCRSACAAGLRRPPETGRRTEAGPLLRCKLGGDGHVFRARIAFPLGESQLAALSGGTRGGLLLYRPATPSMPRNSSAAPQLRAGLRRSDGNCATPEATVRSGPTTDLAGRLGLGLSSHSRAHVERLVSPKVDVQHWTHRVAE